MEDNKEEKFVCKSCGSQSTGTPETCCGGEREKACENCEHAHKGDEKCENCDCGK